MRLQSSRFRFRRVVDKVFGILASRFKVLLGTMKQRPKVVRDIVLACVAQHAEGTPRWTVRAPTPADDIAALQNEQVVYAPDENYRNPLREAKHQQDLDALAGQEDRILDVTKNYPGDRRSWHLSALFKTTQILQEHLFRLVLTNFQHISNKIS